MATVHDVAKHILEQRGPMTALKLQKLVYYAQAWSLVWDEVPLFDSSIKAWENGPVCPDLYAEHRGRFSVAATDLRRGSASELTDDQRETIDAVLKTYGGKTAQWLSDLTHVERPWQSARACGGDSPEITHADMHEYYAGL